MSPSRIARCLGEAPLSAELHRSPGHHIEAGSLAEIFRSAGPPSGTACTHRRVGSRRTRSRDENELLRLHRTLKWPTRPPPASKSDLKVCGRRQAHSSRVPIRDFTAGEPRSFSWCDWHRPCSAPECAASASQNRPAQRLPMANLYLLETLRETAATNRLQIATLIGSLSRSVALLTVDIEHEETRAGVRDLSDPTYPVLARSMRVRRENIRATIAALEALVQGTLKAA
jgi:hypothetical protein